MRLYIKDKLAMLPNSIRIDPLIIEKNVRGVYGIFSNEEEKEICHYIGRAENIRRRFFDYNGHLCHYFWNKDDNNKIVGRLINQILENGKIVKIKVIKEVPYIFDNYFRDMQRLAYEEYTIIEEFQKKKEALNQLPEGNWIKKEEWEKLKPKDSRN